MFRTAFIAVMAVCSFQTQAQTAEVQPGKWEFQTEMRIPGMPQMPSQSMTRCFTQQDIAQNKHLTQNPDKSPCTMGAIKNSAGKISYDFSCKTNEGTVKGSGTGTANANSMEMEMHLQMTGPNLPKPMDITQKMKARRLGNC